MTHYDMVFFAQSGQMHLIEHQTNPGVKLKHVIYLIPEWLCRSTEWEGQAMLDLRITEEFKRPCCSLVVLVSNAMGQSDFMWASKGLL